MLVENKESTKENVRVFTYQTYFIVEKSNFHLFHNPIALGISMIKCRILEMIYLITKFISMELQCTPVSTRGFKKKCTSLD